MSRILAHFCQVRHNGYLTKRLKVVGATAPWSRQFCTVHGNILRCFAGKRQFSDHEDPVVGAICKECFCTVVHLVW